MVESKQQLAIFLSKLKVFDQPDPTLEQYPTDSEVAASLLWDAFMEGEIEGHSVTDLGCGTGILGIGALALGASDVFFVEIDPKVFPALMENLHLLEKLMDKKYGNYRIIQGNVDAYDHPSDVVIQNPPFGVQKQHADLKFLKQAIKIAPVVYSLHKTSTVDYLKKIAEDSRGKVTKIYDYNFPLKRTMDHHEKKIERIQVSALKIES